MIGHDHAIGNGDGWVLGVGAAEGVDDAFTRWEKRGNLIAHTLAENGTTPSRDKGDKEKPLPMANNIEVHQHNANIIAQCAANCKGEFWECFGGGGEGGKQRQRGLAAPAPPRRLDRLLGQKAITAKRSGINTPRSESPAKGDNQGAAKIGG